MKPILIIPSTSGEFLVIKCSLLVPLLGAISTGPWRLGLAIRCHQLHVGMYVRWVNAFVAVRT